MNGLLTNFVEPYINFSSSSTTKVVESGRSKTFIGKEKIIFDVDCMGIFYDGLLPKNPMTDHLKVVTDADYALYRKSVDEMIADPTYQILFVESVKNGMHEYWRAKKLGGTWKQTKDDALAVLSDMILNVLKKLNIIVSQMYSVEVDGKSINTSLNRIGIINYEKFSKSPNFKDIIEAANVVVSKMIDTDLMEDIQNEDYRLENDLITLKNLLAKHPDYKEKLNNLGL